MHFIAPFYENNALILLWCLIDLISNLIILADYGMDKYDIGTGFGHFGIAVEDVSCLYLKRKNFLNVITVSSQITQKAMHDDFV